MSYVLLHTSMGISYGSLYTERKYYDKFIQFFFLHGLYKKKKMIVYRFYEIQILGVNLFYFLVHMRRFVLKPLTY